MTNIEARLEVDLEETQDFFRIYGVNFHNELHIIDLAKKRSKCLAKINLKKEEGIDRVIQKKAQEEFTIGSAPLYANTILAIAECRRQPRLRDLVLEMVRQTLGKAFVEPVKTTSVVISKPDCDKVVHEHSSGTEYSLETDLLGESGYLDTLKDCNKLSKALFEVDDAFKLNFAVKWLTGRGIYVHRFSEPPNKLKIRGISFGNDIYIGNLDNQNNRSRSRWWNWNSVGIRAYE